MGSRCERGAPPHPPHPSPTPAAIHVVLLVYLGLGLWLPFRLHLAVHTANLLTLAMRSGPCLCDSKVRCRASIAQQAGALAGTPAVVQGCPTPPRWLAALLLCKASHPTGCPPRYFSLCLTAWPAWLPPRLPPCCSSCRRQ